MIACFDVHYFEDHTNAAAVVFNDWSDREPIESLVIRCDAADKYVAGKFYQRELVPLMNIINQLNHPIETFVLDAYCHLGEAGSPGLGHFVREQLPNDSNVIGVAKNQFRDTNHAVKLLRGKSTRPLYVTSIGINYQTAANFIKSMHGPNRIPMLLKMVDRMARDGA